MHVLDTERLTLRWLDTGDAEFILRLVNEPSWLRFIGDRGVRTLEDARGYIAKGPQKLYDNLGFGLYLTALKDGTPIGMCGLIKRDTLADVDLGFAFLPEYWGKGYGVESARAVLLHAREDFGLTRVVAITSPDNESSIKLLETIGFRFEQTVELVPGDPVKLFSIGF